MFAPAGTPAASVDRMGTAVRAALRTSGIQEAFAKLGYEPLDTNAEGLGRQVRNELSGWQHVAQVSGFRLED
jgi:tripartite-type tricarboxylate transporter receptor subunit TctC